MSAPFTVASVLDRHIAATEQPREPDGLFHPSAMGSCDRKAVYSMRGTEMSDPPSERSRRIFRVGHTLHEIVQDALTAESGARAVYNEVAVDVPELGITGHADSLLMFDGEPVGIPNYGTEVQDEYELLELKSINQNGFRYLKGQPKPDHEGQARMYAYGLRHRGGVAHVEGCHCDEGGHPWRDAKGRAWDLTTGDLCASCNTTPDAHDNCTPIPPLGDDLKRIRIAYFDKSELQIEEFVLPIDRAWEFDFERRMERLNRYRDSEDNALPPRLPLDKGKPPKWPCDYCDWKTRCWDQDKEGVEI